MEAAKRFSKRYLNAQSRNVLLVAAAGNDGAETPSYIASLSSQFSNVLSAGGLTSDGSNVPESNW